MKNKSGKYLAVGIILLSLFVIFTAAVSYVDMDAIGPEGSYVGFSRLNGFVFKLFGGYNEKLYNFTGLIGYLPIVTALGFMFYAFIEMCKRKSLFKVDSDLIVLGFFYVIIFVLYIGFDEIAINYRPVLIEGTLEPSYPSSHTLMAITFMSTAIMQFNSRVKNKNLLAFLQIICAALLAIIVIGRLMSDVHWFTDILGSVILGSGCVMIYRAAVEFFGSRKKNK